MNHLKVNKKRGEMKREKESLESEECVYKIKCACYGIKTT